jgi:hypothetical protein
MLPVAGAALAAVALKLHASRPRFRKEAPGPYSVPESAAPGAPFRRADKPELATVPFEGCDTIFATFQYATKRNGKRRAVGTRALLQARARCGVARVRSAAGRRAARGCGEAAAAHPGGERLTVQALRRTARPRPPRAVAPHARHSARCAAPMAARARRRGVAPALMRPHVFSKSSRVR